MRATQYNVMQGGINETGLRRTEKMSRKAPSSLQAAKFALFSPPLVTHLPVIHVRASKNTSTRLGKIETLLKVTRRYSLV